MFAPVIPFATNSQRLAKTIPDDYRTQTAWGVCMIEDLTPSPLSLIKPIPAIVEYEDDSYIASFQGANINASGDTLSDAIDMLKEMIISSYDLLSGEEFLSSDLQNELATLKRFVRG